ncbi:MAG: OmpH family outer membrane protein [Sphingobacteriaceae bacterium]
MNKNLLKLTAGLLTVASIIVSCGQDESKTTPAKVTASANAPADQIVYVNIDSLQENYNYFKDLRSKLETKSKNAQGDLTAKGNAFQKEVADYQKSVQTMSADQRAATEQRLARKQQELETYNQNARSALANESAVENEKLYDKISAYIKDYAKKKGYKMVLTYSKGNPTVLFADESLDVTKEVLKGLNDAYKSEKK